MHDISKLIFNRVAKISSVEIHMPNIHYFTADLSKLNEPNSGEVCAHVCVPAVYIQSMFILGALITPHYEATMLEFAPPL